MTYQDDDRPMRRSIWRGLNRRCPNCGKGRLFAGFLKVGTSCSECGEDFTPQRADDGPAYLTILIVGHLMAPFIHVVFTTWRPEPMVMATLFSLTCVTLALYLLPRLKGAVVAIQWARRMHGFGAVEETA